jgi:hypothetical protein
MSITYQWTIEELKKRPSIKLPTDGNAPAGKVPVTTGMGSRTELLNVPIIGNWIYVNNHFNIEPYRNYLVDTSIAGFAGTLPLIPEDKMVIWIKDVRKTFDLHSLMILRHPAATYTINELNDNLEIDVSIDIFLIFDEPNNNWIF